MNSLTEELEILYNDSIKNFENSVDITNYHMNSIHNFIHYIERINDYELKMDVEKQIKYYLTNINKTINTNKMDSIEIFETYVKPISNVFINELNFGVKVKLWIIILWYILSVLILYPIFKSIYVFVILGVFFYVVRIHFLAKERQRKVFGYKY